SWQALESQLLQAPMVAAPAGFGARFQSRLADRRAARASRQTWLVLTGTLGISLTLTALMIPLALSDLATGAARWMGSLLSLQLQLDVLRAFVVSVVSVVPAPMNSLTGLSLGVALAGLAWAAYASLGGIWAAAVYRLAISTNGGTR
ncbi:MAG: hypothetical protein WBR18_15000, partial [Anaerolineales bacterium]